MQEETIVINKNLLTKIRSRAQTIKLLAKDKDLIKEAEEILDLINKESSKNTESLIERIEQKMRETKNSNPELNANLYIIHRNLVRNKISEQDALVLFEMYLSSEPFEKRIY